MDVEYFLSKINAEIRPVGSTPFDAGAERRSVLIVDDEQRLADHLKSRLTNDVEVFSAQNLRGAFIAIDGIEFYAVISDFHLEDGSGLDILRYLAKKRPTTFRVLYAARPTDIEILNKYTRSGVIQRLLVKPIDDSSVREILREPGAEK